MARTTLDHYAGGKVFADTPEGERPRMRYPCFATGCPMPGTIFPETSKDGVCAWHYGVKPNDIPRVTNTLQAWDCVSFEVREARRILTSELRADPAGIQRAFAAAWERLEPLAGTTWASVLAPSTIKHRDKDAPGGYVDTRHHESYADWAKRLEAFVGLQVVESLSVNQRRAA